MTAISGRPAVVHPRGTQAVLPVRGQFVERLIGTLSRQLHNEVPSRMPAYTGNSPTGAIQASLKPDGRFTPTRTLLESAYTLHDSLKWSVGAMSLSDEDQSRMMEMSSLQGPKAWTYGEITFEGVQRLGEVLQPHQGGAFYDLGSGLGRMVLQVHLEWDVDKAVGVELSQRRHSRADRALRELSEFVPLPGRKLELRNENLLTTDLGDATIVYLACTCWDADFMAEVIHKLSAIPSLKWMVSTEDLQEKFQIDNLEERGFRPHQTVVLPMSWDDDWPVHIYSGPAAWPPA